MLRLREYGADLAFAPPPVFLPSPDVTKFVGGAPSERTFLFITAPFGPFSKQLAQTLRKAGARCKRILLNGGDVAEWGLAEAIAYRGGAAGWKSWIKRRLVSEGVTDLVTHGDGHAYAAAAIAVAHELDLNVHVFEQGYFRPHWVTLERDGVNARSNLPRTAEHYRDLVTGLNAPPPVPVGRITPAAVRHIVGYQVLAYLAWPFFHRYRNPYPYPAFLQALGHVRRYLSQKIGRRRHSRALADVFDGSPVFLALLQRPGDSQLTRHSRFEQSGEFVRHVVSSFAQHAAAGARLLFKSHPLDHGLEPHGRAIRLAAEAAGVADRVFFADDGHFPSLIGKAHAVLSVNSTGGLSAVEAGLPTIVLGEAIYDIPGLTHQGGLETFWRAAQKPDSALYRAYRAAAMASCQINGAFSTAHGIGLILPEAARRLLSAHRINREEFAEAR